MKGNLIKIVIITLSYFFVSCSGEDIRQNCEAEKQTRITDALDTYDKEVETYCQNAPDFVACVNAAASALGDNMAYAERMYDCCMHNCNNYV